MKKKEKEKNTFNGFPEYEDGDYEEGFYKTVLEQLYAKAGARFLSEEDEKAFSKCLENYGHEKWKQGCADEFESTVDGY